MEKFNELLAKLESLSITQKSIDWAEDLPEQLWDEYFKGNFKEVASRLNPDEHRWYETSISVIKIYDKFLGIRHISKLFSESSECIDCYFQLQFFEMEEVQVISYKKVETATA